MGSGVIRRLEPVKAETFAKDLNDKVRSYQHLLHIVDIMHWTVDYLITLCDSLGYSQAEVERQAGISLNSIARWKNEGRVPRFNEIEKALNVLGHRLSIVRKEPEFLQTTDVSEDLSSELEIPSHAA